MRMTLRMLLIGLLWFTFAIEVDAEFRVGVAVRVVTPDPLLPVSGGVGTSSPATKKLGELTVRALALERDGVRVAIVGTDFLGFPGVLCDRVRAKVKDVLPENVIIGATHTHSAPDVYGLVDEKGECGADLKYIESVVAKAAEAVNEAVKKLQPSAVKIATDKAKEKIAYNYYAPNLYDRRMNVLQFVAASGEAKGRPIATLVNYATHPEVIGPDQGILSPDLAGPLYDRIEKQGGGTAVFMGGAQGGMVTADCRGPDGNIKTWDECVRIGELMADEALRIVANAPLQEDPPMLCAAMPLRFPVDSDLLAALLEISPVGLKMNADRTVSTQVNVVNLGNAQILTIPGEALPNIGYYLKRKMHGEHNLLFGNTNDGYAYMLTKEDWLSFDRYEYVSRTCLGENTGDIFVEEALKFIDRLPDPLKLGQ